MLRSLGRHGRSLLSQRSSLGEGKQVQVQQKRLMSGGEDDGVHRVNWWDAPTNPDVWQKDQLAWWTIGAYTGLYFLVAGGGKKEKKEAK